MLFFRFNIDEFAAPQQDCTITELKDGKPVSLPQRKTCNIDFGQIRSMFFRKLRDEVSLAVCGIGNALYDVIEVPMDAFNIDNEKSDNMDGAIKFVLSEYAKHPIELLGGKSLKDLGITIEFCKKISNNEINSKLNQYMTVNNLQLLTEEILWKNMNDEEKVKKFLEYLDDCDVVDGELIVIDPYIFSCMEDEYYNMLVSILRGSKAKSVIIITNKRNIQKACYDEISSKISGVNVKYCDEFHDRFWIANRKAGFCCGTSLNGIGKKISKINTLSADEVTDIINELNRQSLIK